MSPRRGIVFILLALHAAGCAGRSGGVQTGGNAGRLRAADVDDPMLAAAARLADAGEGGAAFKELKAWFKLAPPDEIPASREIVEEDEAPADTPATGPATRRRYLPPRPGRPVALFTAADALVEDGHRIKAFYYLDELLDNFPGSPLYKVAAEKQYAIADSYLGGKGDLFLGLPVSRYDEAVEMLFRVQNRLPGSPLAEKSLRRTADFYYQRGDFDFAEDAYGVFIDRFPRSEQIAQVRLLQAYSNVQQFQGPKHDPTPLIDARAQLRQFAVQHPDVAERQNLAGLQDWIDRQLAQKYVDEAGFYRRTNEDRAARRVTAILARQYPDTDAGRDAASSLRRNPTTGPATPPAQGGVKVGEEG